jgi:hypothetical protein
MCKLFLFAAPILALYIAVIWPYTMRPHVSPPEVVAALSKLEGYNASAAGADCSLVDLPLAQFNECTCRLDGVRYWDRDRGLCVAVACSA